MWLSTRGGNEGLAGAPVMMRDLWLPLPKVPEVAPRYLRVDWGGKDGLLLSPVRWLGSEVLERQREERETREETNRGEQAGGLSRGKEDDGAKVEEAVRHSGTVPWLANQTASKSTTSKSVLATQRRAVRWVGWLRKQAMLDVGHLAE